ncbi:hypothetical protein Goklo_006310 [Gossypium klotzschianum]|uniref:Uncharacterized protein n=1 Tax=Gossypium klotzschianum TaxID=34286 RepID=A0A7J8VHM3_9ROSI|nr:hypothetical protein [Gossypium klotzschianum]
MVTKPLGKNLVMGQVKILKRSKLLVTTVEKTDRRCSYGSKGDYEVDLSLGSMNRLGPDLETMQKKIKLKEFKNGDGGRMKESMEEYKVWSGSSSKVVTIEMCEVHEYLGSDFRYLLNVK